MMDFSERSEAAWGAVLSLTIDELGDIKAVQDVIEHYKLPRLYVLSMIKVRFMFSEELNIVRTLKWHQVIKMLEIIKLTS